MFLEGNEVDKTYDNGASHIILDVDDKGGIKLSNVYEKDLDGYAKVKNTTDLETNIFNIAEKIAAKTQTTWDDQAIAGLKSILGIKAE